MSSLYAKMPAKNFRLNGQEHTSVADTLLTLLNELELTGKKTAVEVNGEIIPRSRYAHTLIRTDDCIEIVRAIGGG